MSRRKHQPQRMCVACRQSQDKKTLVRLVRTTDGVFVDQTGKMPGRGAYLHADPTCWELGLRKHLHKALRTVFSEEDMDRLNSYLETLTAESELEIED